MTEKVKHPRTTKQAMKATNKKRDEEEIREALETLSRHNWPLWPDEEGKITLPEHLGEVPKKSSSRLSRPSRRARKKSTSPQQSAGSFYSWRAAKSFDIVSFHTGAESYFVEWLTDRINESDGGFITLGWLYSNAAFELDVSIETVKRYLAKHTAEKAEFLSNGKTVSLREPF